MAKVERSVLVEHTAAAMFELVDRIEDYPEFLPWCGGSTLIERTPALTLATLEINYHGVRQSLTTRNRKETPEWMHIEMEKGPFRKLTGHWHFRPLSDRACKIEFQLEYEFSSRILENIVGPVFSYIANTFVEAFVNRADALRTAQKIE